MFQSRGSVGIVDKPFRQGKQEVRRSAWPPFWPPCCSTHSHSRPIAQETCAPAWQAASSPPLPLPPPLRAACCPHACPACSLPLPALPQVALSSFAYLFSELVQYCQSRVTNVGELERK